MEELESDFAELAQLMNQGVVSNLVNISDFGEVADFNLAASRSQLSLDSYDGASTDDFDGGRSHYTTSRSTLDDLDDDLPTQQLPAEVVGFSDLEDAFSKFEMAGVSCTNQLILKLCDVWCGCRYQHLILLLSSFYKGTQVHWIMCSRENQDLVSC